MLMQDSDSDCGWPGVGSCGAHSWPRLLLLLLQLKAKGQEEGGACCYPVIYTVMYKKSSLFYI